MSTLSSGHLALKGSPGCALAAVPAVGADKGAPPFTFAINWSCLTDFESSSEGTAELTTLELMRRLGRNLIGRNCRCDCWKGLPAMQVPTSQTTL